MAAAHLQGLVAVNGLYVNAVVAQERLDYLKTLPLRSDDTWIATYPKSGTTWVQQIARLSRNGGQEDGMTVSDSVPWLEWEVKIDFEVVKRGPSPRVFKTHSDYANMPCGLPHVSGYKCIYIARNPKDVAVSLFHHVRALKAFYQPCWEEFYKHFVAGEVEGGDWFDHVLSFWAHKDDDNILFLKYEDMKKDLPTAVAAVAKFMGYDLTQEVIEDICVKSTFTSMAQNPSTNFVWSNHRRNTTEPPFMRKGVVGDWKNYFTAEQSAQFDAIYTERMKGTGLDFIFSDICV